MTRLEEADLEDVPVFPLPHVVLFPDALLPLHIFEPRYRTMLADCLAANAKAIVIAQVDRGGARIASVAGAGVIVDHHALPDGRSNIVVVGRARVRLDELVTEAPPRYPYKRARVTQLSSLEAHVNEGDRSALLAAATMFASEVTRHDPSFEFQMPTAADAGSVADGCAFQLVVDANVRQAILEELDPRRRVRMVMDQLALQHGAMMGEKKGAVLQLTPKLTLTDALPSNAKEVGRVALAELKEKGLVRLPYPPFDVLVAWADEEAFAIEDACNHAGASLAEGWLEGDCVVCPMHAYVFELRTGKLERPRGLCGDQRTYDTRIEGDEAVVYDSFDLLIGGAPQR